MNILSIIIGIAGLAYALYQSREKQKLIDYNRSQAWYLYSKANNMAGFAQAAFKKYKEYHINDLNTEVIELMAGTSAFGQDLFCETIRLIQLSEEDFSYKNIDIWQNNGKIHNNDHKKLFIELVVEPTKKRFNFLNPPKNNTL